MLVEASYDSHASMWNALLAPVLKSAHRDIFGDVYEPLTNNCLAPWTASSYAAHLAGHEHNPSARIKDIEVTYYGRNPRLLLGDPAHSYLWTAPRIRLQTLVDKVWTSTHHRFYPDLASFLRELR
jgi:hypothetical protein